MIFRNTLYSLLCALTLALFQQCGQPKQFSEVDLSDAGIDFRNDIKEDQVTNIMTYEYTYNGGGVATGDVNNDGLADIYFSGNTVPNKLYLNNGDLKFEDITQQSGTSGRPLDWKTGVTMVDINGDGWLDIYVCYSGNANGEGYNKPVIRDHPKRANQLFINQGCEKGGVPVFVEQAREYGVDAKGTFSTQAYFFDYDRDGDLDLFLLNHANMFYSAYFNVKRLRNLRHPYFGNKLYRNDANKFVEVSERAKIHGSGLNFGLSASVSDLNGDQWPDIYVTNDYEEQDFCYINNRDGTFTEMSHTLFGHLSKFGMGSDIADINNDGLPEIFVADMLPEDNYRQKVLKGADEYDKYTLAVDSGYYHQYMRNTLQLNRGFASDSLPRFSEVAQIAGVSHTDWSWAPLLADYDNDGLKDLFISNGYLKDFTNLDFLKYTVNDMSQEANAQNRPVDVLAMVQKMQSTKTNRYIFKNTDGLRFENVSALWGLDRKTVSNAAAYADLDNDGDYDLVVNNLNDDASILQNHQEKIQKNNFVRIKLVGAKPNTQALGSKVSVKLADKTLVHEIYFTRGYQSSVDPVLTIGIGTTASIPEIKVQWTDGRVSTLANVKPNQLVTIAQQQAVPHENERPIIHKPILVDETSSAGLKYKHVENNFVDFKVQRLVPYQLSHLGGKLSVADINHDQNDDVFFEGSHGNSAKLFMGHDDGSFTEAEAAPWAADKYCEDIGSIFFDADGDGNEDLYVVSGGNEFMPGDTLYQDRLYKGDGKGGFMKIKNALPIESISGGSVKASDFDKDGDLDLFVGGRLVPDAYPTSPQSMLLRNDSHDGQIHFVDITTKTNAILQNAGMITDAIWADVNKDTWPDLIIAGEWIPVRVFQNIQGKEFKDVTADVGLADTQGWWSSLLAADVDHDGDIDLLAGNAGINLPLHISAKEPVQLYASDINKDSKIDPIICSYIQGKSYPLPSRDELLDQVTPLRKKFIRYADYATATIEDVIGKDLLSSAAIYKATTLQSSWFENDGHGKFVMKPLPPMAQLSSTQAFVFDDFDGDGIAEVLAAGNFYPYRVQLGRCDASFGILLKFKDGSIQTNNASEPLWLSGDIRDMAMTKFKRAPRRLIVSRNNEDATVFQLTTTNVSNRKTTAKK
ncbi:VCBS repeat-containing protein [Ohtaekwangia koreensis]|uniref:Repeat domain-containing protein n=1 Tax=Ohtaekwangia koreensis TaxID=688867 RepID=A0A1T5JIL2_9BACT|nr:VCBS repeat-containing protein [Ohtaekwangia koreensis]SKC51003.1 Repeat domain-containing protein [Ohtaekwangia koreensis]